MNIRDILRFAQPYQVNDVPAETVVPYRLGINPTQNAVSDPYLEAAISASLPNAASPSGYNYNAEQLRLRRQYSHHRNDNDQRMLRLMFLENADAVGFDPERNVWIQLESPMDERNRGYGTDMYTNGAIDRRNGNTWFVALNDDGTLDEEDERIARNFAFDKALESYNARMDYARRQGITDEQINNLSPFKQQLLIDLIYGQGSGYVSNRWENRPMDFNGQSINLFDTIFNGTDRDAFNAYSRIIRAKGIGSRIDRWNNFITIDDNGNITLHDINRNPDNKRALISSKPQRQTNTNNQRTTTNSTAKRTTQTRAKHSFGGRVLSNRGGVDYII